jgi:hypothetical protein
MLLANNLQLHFAQGGRAPSAPTEAVEKEANRWSKALAPRSHAKPQQLT